MHIKGIKETCLYVKDLDKCADFYHNLLSFPIISKVKGRHVFFRVGNDVLLCFISAITKNETSLPPHYAEGKQHIAFEVSRLDYESTKQAISNNNIPIIHEQSWQRDYKSFYFEDPDGHVLEIVPEGMWD